MNNTTPKLDDCGCCKGVDFLTPTVIDNDHGLLTLLYRVGTHGMFKESMLRGLSGSPTLKELTIREDDDATIALMDVWALILDVLTFYNERIINEGYILTAKERLSLVELAKHISYIPKPGVAAGSWLSFLMETSPGAPPDAKVPVGTRVQSIPGQDEKAQIFETIESIHVKQRWNAIQPKLYENQVLTNGSTQLYLQGTTTQLQQGDYILFVGTARTSNSSSNKWAVRVIHTVTIDSTTDTTLVTWKNSLTKSNLLVQTNNGQSGKVYALRQRAALFGYNAPDFKTMSKEVKESFNGTGGDSDNQWDGFLLSSFDEIHLDALYPKILKDSWIVFSKPGHREIFKVDKNEPSAKTNFAIATKASKIKLDKATSSTADFERRDTLVLAQSEEQQLAKAPVLTNIAKNSKSIDLNRDYPELIIGQKLIISGELTPQEITSPDQKTTASELVEIESFATNRIIFKNPLQNSYIRKTVTISANVAQSTHGESKSEILGSGNAAIPFQKFYLKQKPLTYISAATASGIATTLEIRVDDIKWTEVPTLYNRTSEERIFISRTEDDGTTFVQFGNGITGTRLPSGVENVRANYRVGIGLEGILKAKQLSLLLNPQLGIKEVTNPLPTTGAEDPEAINNIRHNAPLTILTLERIVSVEDFENFTSAFAGIGKARADLLWKGEDRTVHLTVASADQGTIDTTLEENLLNAINAARHDNYPVIINSFVPQIFNVISRIKVHPDYLPDKVIDEVKATLFKTYHFDVRSFGQNVAPSEVIAIIHSVDGVEAVDLDELGGKDPFTEKNYLLVSNMARYDHNQQNILPAELLLIDQDNIEITLMSL